MKLNEWKLIAPVAILSIGLAAPVFAQNDNGASASQSMSAAGQSMKDAGSNTGTAAKHAYHGTATALRDTKITTKVKTELGTDHDTRHSEIHVTTTAGVVTLEGSVPSQIAATRAQQLAAATEGVKQVDNRLTVEAPSAAD